MFSYSIKSILKIWINLLFWKSIATANPVFECTFDNGKCPNGDFIFNPSSSVSITDNQFISGHSLYRITDVTSITTPTKNGEICLLPFTEGNYEYYHCYNYYPYSCPTKSGRGECTLGKYVLGKSPLTGAEIDIKGTSSQITLPETGSYELSFYVLMFTNITDMTLGGDYIQVSVNSAVNSSLSYKSEKYDYTNIGKANVWQKKSFKFNAPEENIILVVDFVRLNRAEKVGYFGFDQIEIISSSVTSSATSSATTTTTTKTTITTSQTTSSSSSSAASTPTSFSTTFSTSTTTITSLQTSTLTSSSTTLSSTTTSTTSITASQTTFSTSSSSASSTTLFSTTSSTSTTTITTSQTKTSTTTTKLSLSPTFSTKTSGSPSTLTSSSTRFSTATKSYSSSSSKTVSFYASSKSTRTTYSKNSTATGNTSVSAPTVASSFITTTKSSSSPESTLTILPATTKMRTTSTELLSSISNSESIKISSTVKTDSFGPSNYPSLILTTLSENLDNSSADKTWLHYLLGFGTPTLIGFSIGICFYKSCFKSKRRVRNSDSISLHDY